MAESSFIRSIRFRALVIGLLLLLVPWIGFRFVQDMDDFLREGQERVLASAAKLLSASLSDRPALFAEPAEEADAERAARQRTLAMFGSADPVTAVALGSRYQPSEQVEKILGVVAGNATRIWVVDVRSRVRGLGGSLSTGYAGTAREGGLAHWYGKWVRPQLRKLASARSGNAAQDLGGRDAVMAQVDRALRGEPTTRWREGGVGGEGGILSVAQPVWQGETIVAAVVLEESGAGSQAIRVAALESLLATTGLVLLVAFLALLGFAWRIAWRVRRLQREADAAIDEHGRIRGRIAGSAARDEVGALSHTLASTLERLGRYNEYLEQMASRLSHELRTPLAVVRSSLDNLRQRGLDESERVYVERADEGVRRLAALIARMSEATQLEGMLRDGDRVRFDLARLVAGSVEGYRVAYPAASITLDIDGGPAMMTGLPDALVQMLDKLVQNAVDFATPGTPVRVQLASRYGQHVLSVENTGPMLPPDVAANVFTSLVSSRAGATAGKDGHLGLGLYIVRLVVEFHHGRVSAENLHDGSGVRFSVSLPALSLSG